MTDLTVREHMVLRLEQQRWKYAGAKEAAVREQLGWSAPRYYQVLNQLLDRADAHAEYPLLVKRLRRLREKRARARGARLVGWQV